MRLSLSANISKWRKEKGMTQEQLAEVLGVTFASVSKWERGVATPELNLIAEMADFFGVSLDALIGFKVQHNGAGELERRIFERQNEKKYDEAMELAEKSLRRYPNDFRIVYRSGELYAVAGIERKDPSLIHRCIALLEHSISLLSQNTDAKISEASIQYEIAQCDLALGETEKALEILKKYNVSGVYNALIALTCTGEPDFDLKAAEPYMNSAFGDMLSASISTMMAYANYYFKIQDYRMSREALLWLGHSLESLKLEPNTAAYVDKIIAPCYGECANLSFLLGEEEKAEIYLRRAYAIAKSFDAAPVCNGANMKFQVGDDEKAVTYDDLGESVIDLVEEQLTKEDHKEILYQIWKKMIGEKHGNL